MTTSEQLADFTIFAKAITQREGEDISLDVIYERWWQQLHRDDDLAAIREAHAQFESGERGEDARAELAAFRSEKRASNTQ